MIKPYALDPGSTIGVFTPSVPYYLLNEELFLNGLKVLERLGFRIKLGDLTRERAGQGYRSGTPQQRAQEFMDLIRDPEVHALVPTIGGSNSSSLIPYLDFAEIADSRKVVCGYSDVTSLHMAILKYSGLQTFYSPAVMSWFGDWPDGVAVSNQLWLDAVSRHYSGGRKVTAPAKWSNHNRRWDNGDWKNVAREWQDNSGWKVLSEGTAEGPIIAANLNTLMSSAGTPYWPDLKGCILLVEEMTAPLSREERHLRHLDLLGVFDQISGLIVGKPEDYDGEDAPFGYDDLIMEIVGERSYLIVTGFDCGHTLPMITIPQFSPVRLNAAGGAVDFEFLDGAIASR